MAVRMLLAGFLLGLPACSFSVNYDGSHFACDPPDGQCPANFYCSADGFCVPVPDGGVPDAGADAPGNPTDAAPDAEGLITLTFGERPDSLVQGVTSDTRLELNTPDTNYGTSNEFSCDSNPLVTGLVRFDLSSIPSGATVVSASLELWTGTDPLQQGTIQLHRVVEAWTEGNLDGTVGAASWNQRMPGIAWSAPGALVPSIAPVVSSELSTPGMLTPYAFVLPTSLVQSWVDTPSTNFGLACLVSPGVDSDSNFKASESSQLDRRPELTITYQP